MMAAVSDEARFHPRMQLEVTADVLGSEVMLACPLDDISLGGCRFASRAWEPKGQELQLVLAFPRTGASVPVHGVVVRTTEHDMGVRFDEITDEQKWALRKQLRDTQSR